MKDPRIVLFERDDVARELYTEYLVGEGIRVRAEALFDDAVAALKKGGVPVLVAGIAPGGATVAQLAAAIRRVSPHTALLAILGREAAEGPLRAVRDGALEVLTRPVSAEGLILAVHRGTQTYSLLERHPDMRRHLAMYQAARRLQRAPDAPAVAEQLLDTVLLCAEGDAGFVLATNATGGRDVIAARGLDEQTVRELATGWDPRALTEPAANAPGGQVEPGPAFWFVSGTGVMAKVLGRNVRVAPENIVVRVGPVGAERMWATILFAPKKGATDVGPHGGSKRDAGRAALLAELALYAAEAAFALSNAGRYPLGAAEPSIDPVTDLPDAGTLERTIARELSRVKRSGGSAAVLSIDVSRIIEIEQTHGPEASAQALLETARILVRAVRDVDVVARIGPLEFGAVLMGTDAAGAKHAAERIRATIDSHRFLAREGLDLRLSVSVGVAAWPTHGDDAPSLIAAAAAARSKGRGTVSVAAVRQRTSRPRA